MTHTLEIVAPAPREAAQLTLVLWAAALSVIVPGIAVSGQMAGTGEWITLIWGTLAAILLASLIYVALRWASGRPLWIAIPLGVAALLVTALAQMAADFGGQFFVHAFMDTRVPDHSAQSVLLVTVIYFLIDGCTAALFVILGTVRRIRLREQELAAARVAGLETELNLLRLQLNPHFLCNSLNAVSSLILTGRTDEANRMVEGLSDFLRATMDLDTGMVPLADELETVERYLELEGARFGERLRVTIAAEPGTLGHPVPSFLLQPLVENA
ncbi:MAG TPA: histidine kinase, partial [Sphingomonas sp.]|nr:histidine kinase [Sphingomonas sp.]